MRVTKVERDPKDARQLIITVETGVLWWKRSRLFAGRCTVWHDAETGERPGTLTETLFSQVWWKWKRENA